MSADPEGPEGPEGTESPEGPADNPDAGDQGNRAGRLRGVLEWLREGYPAGVPPKDYIPLLALLRRRLTEEDVREVARQIALVDDADRADIGVRITKITDAMPSEEDVARVEAHLTEHHGWPESP